MSRSKVRRRHGHGPAVPEQAKSAGYEPVDINMHSEWWKEAFLSPRETNGILIQLAQTNDQPNPDLKTLEEYLADRPGLRPD